MNTLQHIEHWADTHHPRWIDFIRIALGMFIFYKGVLFISNKEALMNMMNHVDTALFNMAMVHYVAFAHLFGGVLIALGLMTRLAVVFQLPILLVAVFLVNINMGFFSVANNLEFEISLIVLILLIVFLVYGSGKFSVDQYMKDHPHW
ncbi:MAG TPA: DoxX family protein [Cyclobacteriaceae bacterium]|nr:DoxX family protein [Cyclobacteriaceae bacterium]